MNMKDVISIVVPIYNVGKYLEQCINSLVKQTYHNIEIILVDDGSTDNSGEICDKFAQKDARIKVIHQANKGLTVTRRAGVNLASGKYVGFVDGDDWIEPDMYEKLYEFVESKQVDIVTSTGCREYEWGVGEKKLGDTIKAGRYIINEENEYIINRVLSCSIDGRERINGSMCFKLFKKNIISKVLNDIDEKVHGFMDDTVCVFGAIINSKSIYITNECLYHHREHSESFTYSRNPEGLKQVNYAYLSLKKIIEDAGYKDKLYKALCELTSINMLQAYNILFEDTTFRLPEYLFRSQQVPLKSRILIYGAGRVGQDYMQQLQADNKYEIVGIADKNAKNIMGLGNVCTLDEILNLDFDTIILATANRDLAVQMERGLVRLGIEKEKILWEKPISIFEYFQ